VEYNVITIIYPVAKTVMKQKSKKRTKAAILPAKSPAQKSDKVEIQKASSPSITTSQKKNTFQKLTIPLLVGTTLVLLVGVIAIMVLLAISLGPARDTIQSNTEQVAEESIATPEIEDTPLPSLPSTGKVTTSPAKTPARSPELQEFDDYIALMATLVNEQNPTVALDKVLLDLQTKPNVQRDCHTITHRVGDLALQKYKGDIKTAIQYDVDVCGGGYVHGLVEHFIDLSPNPAVELLTVCQPNDGTCYHGVGHGLMLVNKMDIPKSVQGCQSLSGSNAQLWCAEGVFMENFDSENVAQEEKPFLNPANPSGICDQNTGIYRNACYYYLGRYIFKQNGEPKASLQLCKQSGSVVDQQACVRGMGAGIVRTTLLQPTIMETYCDSIPDMKVQCMEGAVNYHLLLLKSSERTKNEMCLTFANSANQELCLQAISRSPFRT
jgi:hypothetical protein